MQDTFAALGLGQELLTELATLGYEEPTPIQKAAIAPLIEGKDLLGQAATGTGDHDRADVNRAAGHSQGVLARSIDFGAECIAVFRVGNGQDQGLA